MKQLSEITRNVVLFCLLVAAMACPVALSAQTQGTGNRVFHGNQIPLKLVFVKGGDMQMGCSDERDGDCMSQEVPTHTVTLTDFYIGETEITQAQWMAVMGRDNNPSYWKGNTLPGPTAPFALIQPGPDSGSVDIAGGKNPRYCNGYKRDDGFVYQTFPADLAVLKRCTPVYEELPGWQCETSHITDYSELPENAKKYVNRILDLVGGKLGVLSVGPARETTLRINV